MSYYLALLTINDKTNIISIHPTLYKARDMVKNINKLPSDIIITSIVKSIPTETNMDGYYLVSDENDGNIYYLYKKITQLSKGWIYNSIDIQINKEGTLEIQEIQLPQNNTLPVINIKECNTSSTSVSTNNEEPTIEPRQLLQNIKVIDELKTRLGNLDLRSTKKKYD